VPAGLVADGKLDVCIDIDRTHNFDAWAVTVWSSTLSTAWVAPSKTMLWPPNHKMVEVKLKVFACDGAVCRIVGVKSNEPINGLGDGDTAPDWIIAADGQSVQLRAERSGLGTGRVYTICVACDGNIAKVRVLVPHDMD